MIQTVTSNAVVLTKHTDHHIGISIGERVSEVVRYIRHTAASSSNVIDHEVSWSKDGSIIIGRLSRAMLRNCKGHSRLKVFFISEEHSAHGNLVSEKLEIGFSILRGICLEALNN